MTHHAMERAMEKFMREAVEVVSELLEKDSQRGALILTRDERRAIIKLLEF